MGLPGLSLSIDTKLTGFTDLASFSEPVSFEEVTPEASQFEILASEQTFKNAYFTFQCIINEFESSLSLETLRDKLHEFHLSSTTLTISDIPVIHRLYFHIWDLSVKKDPSIHGDRWGEIHAYDDQGILHEALKKTAFELYYLKIQEALTRFESPIRKAKTGSLSHNPQHLSKEYLELFERFLEFFEDPKKDTADSFNDILSSIRIESPSWMRKKTHIIRSCVEARMHPLYNKPLFWVTGSSTHSLVGVFKAREHAFTYYKPSLVPTGMLLKHDIVPLSGELGDGITTRGVNQEHLSGVLAEAYKGALMYACINSFYFDRHQATTSFEDSFRSFLSLKPSKDLTTQLDRLKIKLIRAVSYGHLPADSIPAIKAELLAWASAHHLDLKTLEAFIGLLDTIKKEDLPSELEELIDTKAEPLLYGISSFSEESEDLINRRIKGDVRLETSLRGPLALGNLVDIAITSNPQAAKMLNTLLPFPVLSFDAGKYLLSRQGKTD